MTVDNLSDAHIDSIHLAFDATRLESLILEGKLHIADFTCLDETSKKGVWSMMRSVVMHTMRLS